MERVWLITMERFWLRDILIQVYSKKRSNFEKSEVFTATDAEMIIVSSTTIIVLMNNDNCPETLAATKADAEWEK